jgi:hypothetical protein
MLASASVPATDSMSGTRASNARTGWNCTFAWIDAMGEGAVATVLQQGCFPAPILQLPAIFLQQSISACAIFGLGRQASAGVASQIARRASTRMDRHRITTTCYLFGKPPRNLDRSRNTLTHKILLTVEPRVLVSHTSHELATGAVPWSVGLPAESVDAPRPSQALYRPLATSGRRPLHHTSPANAASPADAGRKA